MDALDRRILREVQRDCSPSASVLADRCGTTESTALRRLRRLQKDGIISGPHMRVRPDRVGRGLKLILSFQLKDECKSERKELRDRLVAHPDVSDFFWVTGSRDYFLILTIASMEDYERFLREVILGTPLVFGSESHFVIETLKVAAPIPIDEPARA